LILAIFGGKGWALADLWLFWLAPILGAIAAGYLYSSFFEESKQAEVTESLGL
jgi:aquaporin Z